MNERISFFLSSLFFFCHIYEIKKKKHLCYTYGYGVVETRASASSIERIKSLSKGVHPEVIFFFEIRLKLTGKIDLIRFDPVLFD